MKLNRKRKSFNPQTNTQKGPSELILKRPKRNPKKKTRERPSCAGGKRIDKNGIEVVTIIEEWIYHYNQETTHSHLKIIGLRRANVLVITLFIIID